MTASCKGARGEICCAWQHLFSIELMEEKSRDIRCCMCYTFFWSVVITFCHHVTIFMSWWIIQTCADDCQIKQRSEKLYFDTSYETRQCWWATERAPAVNPLYRHTCYKRLQHGTCNVVIENLYLPWKCSKKKQWKSTIGSVFLINAMLHLVALNNNVSNINGWIACRTGVHLTLLFVLL